MTIPKVFVVEFCWVRVIRVDNANIITRNMSNKLSNRAAWTSGVPSPSEDVAQPRGAFVPSSSVGAERRLVGTDTRMERAEDDGDIISLWCDFV